MRFWTMLMSLIVVAVLATGAYAQEKKAAGKHGGHHQMQSFKDMVGSDDGKLTEDLLVKAYTKNVPDDRKEQATTRVKAMWKRLAGDKTELTKDEFEAARKKMVEEWQAKGGKKK